jgi:PPOX class probable F420-dependent enzyme
MRWFTDAESEFVMSAVPESIPSEFADLVTGKVYPALATFNPDGSIQVTPLWAGSDDECLTFNTLRGRRKDLNLRERPTATLFYQDPVNPYRWLSVTGDIVESIDETDPERGHLATETIDDFSDFYNGVRPFPNRRPGDVRVLYRLRPTKVLTSG